MQFEELSPVLIGLLLLVPVFFILRVRLLNKRKRHVVARCMQCGHDQHIPHLTNLVCETCENTTEFYDASGQPKMATYDCGACGALNVKGVLTCHACGKSSPDSLYGS